MLEMLYERKKYNTTDRNEALILKFVRCPVIIEVNGQHVEATGKMNNNTILCAQICKIVLFWK